MHTPPSSSHPNSAVHVRGFGGGVRNCNTVVAGVVSPVDLREAYTFARTLSLRERDRPTQGHRLVWMTSSDGAISFGSSVLTAAADSFAVVGRHTQCVVHLDDDPSVALRHLLIRSVPRANPSGVALRVLDLQTALGFRVADGSRQESVFAEGPVAFSVGAYAVIALPLDVPVPELLPPAALQHVDDVAGAFVQDDPYRGNAYPVRRTRITLMPSVVMVGESAPASLRSGAFELTLTREGRAAGVRLGERDLLRGVIIGRSEKCHSEQLRRVTSGHISRTHVLVLREGDENWLYDLASMHGTFANAWPVRRFLLPDQGARLTLGRLEGAVEMTWRRA